MFLAPFGTPFVGPDAPEYARELMSEPMLREYGYFDPEKVRAAVAFLEKTKAALAKDRREHVRLGRSVWLRTMYGMAVTLVLSTQLLESYVRAGDFADHPPRSTLSIRT